jgi:hypothetical protein
LAAVAALRVVTFLGAHGFGLCASQSTMRRQ